MELQKIKNPAMDEILGKKFSATSNGWVRVVDYMGGDGSIVQAARTSYGKGTKKVHEDRGLIRYLMRHRHTTPFEMCEIKLHVRAPMDVWRQWIRHRMASVNEYSTRYSVAIDATNITPPEEWRLQSAGNRQGSDGSLEPETGSLLSKRESELHTYARKIYEERLEHGVAREQARKDLPLSTYTEAYWKIDLHNLLHFLSLRMDNHAQKEIRDYADIIGHEIVSKWCPLTWEAFLDYRMHSMSLTKIEIEIIKELMTGELDAAREIMKQAGWLQYGKKGLKRNRERNEAETKFNSLGMNSLWDVLIAHKSGES